MIQGASVATTLRYYLSTDGTITTSDTALGTDAVPALGRLVHSGRCDGLYGGMGGRIETKKYYCIDKKHMCLLLVVV